eukprot:2017130-Rhodomonas_salina.2
MLHGLEQVTGDGYGILEKNAIFQVGFYAGSGAIHGGDAAVFEGNADMDGGRTCWPESTSTTTRTPRSGETKSAMDSGPVSRYARCLFVRYMPCTWGVYDLMCGGMQVADKGEGKIEDNEIFLNKTAGLEVRDGGNPVSAPHSPSIRCLKLA